MKSAVHISYFNYSNDNKEIAPKLIEIVQTIESAGIDAISVMDHYFQIAHIGPKTDPMMEAYTVLSFIAAHTKKVKLGTLVTGVIYREPAFLVNQVTALDVLSGGRAWFGIGAAWNEEESIALGFNFPPIKERFERLEETIKIAKQMWSGDTKPFHGKYYTLEEPINNPQPITKPHPPILIGGGGEQKTLKFVAKYADACNLFFGPELEHKLDVLKNHCKNVGRNYNDIETTVSIRINFDEGDTPEKLLENCKYLSDLGINKVFFNLRNLQKITPIITLGDKIIPQLSKL